MKRLRSKVLLVTVGCLVLSVALLGGLGVFFLKHRLEGEFELRTLGLARSVQHVASEGLSTGNEELVRDYLDSLLADPDLEEAYVLASDGRLVAAKSRGAVSPPPLNSGLCAGALEVFTPRTGPGRVGGVRSREICQRLWAERPEISTLGAAYLRFSFFRVDRQVEQALFWFLLAGAFLAGLTFALGYFLAGRITAPLERLRAASEAIGRGDFSVSVPADSNDEIGALARDFQKMSDEIRATEDQLRLLANITDNSPLPIIMTDPAALIRVWNDAAEKLFGWSRMEIMGTSLFRELVPPSEEESVRRVFTEVEMGRTELKLKKRGGAELPVEATISTLRDAKGGMLGRVAILQDLAELKRLRQSLFQTEKLSIMGQVVAGVAHELNNPLTGILGYGNLLLAEAGSGLDPKAKEDLQTIVTEAERCQKIVRNLTVFARQHKAEKTYSDLNAVIRETLKLEHYQLMTRNIEVKADYGPIPPTMADGHQLQQVFLNLFVNAEQAMSADRGKGTLMVKTRAAEGQIRIEVQDDGPGIPAAALSRIFEPFFTTKEVGKGTGLGLALSYGIVEEHGGRIWAENVQGRGAMFVVELPVTAPEEPPAGCGPQAAAAPLRQGLRVLVVDDEKVVRDLLARIVKEMGQNVESAENGRQAMEKLAGGDYDLVCCDLRMPDMDGFELFRWAQGAKPQLVDRWIFITGSVTEDTQAFLDSTGRPQLHKPFDVEVLRKAVRGVLDGAAG